MNHNLAQFFIIFLQVVINTTGNFCSPQLPYPTVEMVVRESPERSVSCTLQAVLGVDLPQNQYSHSPLPTEPFYAGTASASDYTALPSLSFEDSG